jgi:hypothetical protein
MCGDIVDPLATEGKYTSRPSRSDSMYSSPVMGRTVLGAPTASPRIDVVVMVFTPGLGGVVQESARVGNGTTGVDPARPYPPTSEDPGTDHAGALR